MYYVIIIIGFVLYYLYHKGILKLKTNKKSEDTKNHILKKAQESYEKGELSEEEYDNIKKDLEDN